MFENLPDIMNVEDIMKALRIGKNKAYKLIQTNMIHALKLGKVYRVPKNELIKYVIDTVSAEYNLSRKEEK